MVEIQRIKDRVAIVGFCQPDREWVDYDDDGLEVWGLNRGYIFMPRAERWFEMHGPAIHEWEQRRPGNHMQFLQQFAGPVYMHQARPDLIPNAVDYPLAEVAEDLGLNLFWRFDVHGIQTQAAPYLTSTVSQEIALAIHLGYREISLYGIDLNTASEYAWQKPGVEYMLGVALGRGIRVRLPAKCPLLAGEIYGRGYLSPRGEHLSPEQWMERIKALTESKNIVERQINEAGGGKHELEWVISQIIPGLDHEALDQRKNTFDKAIGEQKAKLMQIMGALQETLYWAHQTPAGQDPSEALAQLIAAEQGTQAEHPVEAIKAMAGRYLETQPYTPAEGPEMMGVTSLLLDQPSSGSRPAAVVEQRSDGQVVLA